MDRRNFMQTAVAAPLLAGSVGVAEAKVSTRSKYLAIAEAMITSWRRRDLEGMLSHIDDDIVWHSHVGSPPFVGKPAMRDFATKLMAQMNDVQWRIFGAAADGDRLYVEGVDDFVDAAGRRIVIPYEGVLVFRASKVREWRDYFDRGLFDRLKAGEPLPEYLVPLTTRKPLF
jgi:limonene-1,2-epoxide hydrolase